MPVSDIKYMKAVEFDKLPAKFKKQYVNEDGLEKAGYWLQQKYDGCFGKAEIAVARKDCRMKSRTGEDYSTSCAHILDDLHAAASDQGSFDPFCVLGEVWAEGVSFPDISGMFRRQTKGVQKALSFVCNDLLCPDMETTYPYRMRFADLKALIVGDFILPNLRLAKTYMAGDWGDARGLARAWVAMGGFDGAILRNPDAGYTFGLVKDGAIVKVKPLLELDLRVDEVMAGVGEKTDRPVYTIKVSYRGVTSKVGSGMPHARADCPNVGDIVRIDSLGLTEDGALREPRYIGIRHDKTQPDQ